MSNSLLKDYEDKVLDEVLPLYRKHMLGTKEIEFLEWVDKLASETCLFNF